MATKPEFETPVSVVKEQKNLEHKHEEQENLNLPPKQVPAGNPKEHPTRRR